MVFRSKHSEVTDAVVEAEVVPRPALADRVAMLEARVEELETTERQRAVKDLPEYTRQKLAAEAEQAELERLKAEAAKNAQG